jgi:NADH/F420H2 dehydrogenase subunit C
VETPATILPTTQRLIERFGDQVVSHHAFRGDETVVLTRSAIGAALRFLKETPGLDFNMLSDLTIVDYLTYPEAKPARFEVVYHLFSLTRNTRIRLKVPVDPGQSVETATTLWVAADWMEREAWEMYGVKFEGHPNLKRLLTHVDFVGYPLRKDYPLKKRQPLTETDSMMDEMEKRLKLKGLK